MNLSGYFKRKRGGTGARFGKGRKHTPEELIKMVAAQTGRKHLPETIAKLSAGKIGNEARRNVGKWPHELGVKCNCKECLKKKSDNLAYRRDRNNLMTSFVLEAQ